MPRNDMLRAALDYIAVSIPVFPLAARAKVPMVSKAAGGRGFHDATLDPEQVTRWWTQWPSANIGIVPPASYLVLDVDPLHGGSLDQLGDLPPTWAARTGSGGYHLWYKASGQLRGRVRGTRGIDVKGNRTGYLVAAPSIHPSGNRYRWITSYPIALLPAHLRDRVLAPTVTRVVSAHRTADSDGSGLVRTVREAQPGQRNSLLFWAVCTALQDGREDLVPSILDAGTACGLQPFEVERTAASARRRIGVVAA